MVNRIVNKIYSPNLYVRLYRELVVLEYILPEYRRYRDILEELEEDLLFLKYSKNDNEITLIVLD